MIKRRTLSVLLVIIGLANLIRAGMSFRMHALFVNLQVPSLLYLGVFYAGTGLIFIMLGVEFWRKSHQWAFFLILGYECIVWILRLVTYHSSYARSIWLRDAIFSFLFLGFVFFLVYIPHKTIT